MTQKKCDPFLPTLLWRHRDLPLAATWPQCAVGLDLHVALVQDAVNRLAVSVKEAGWVGGELNGSIRCCGLFPGAPFKGGKNVFIS